VKYLTVFAFGEKNSNGKVLLNHRYRLRRKKCLWIDKKNARSVCGTKNRGVGWFPRYREAGRKLLKAENLSFAILLAPQELTATQAVMHYNKNRVCVELTVVAVSLLGSS